MKISNNQNFKGLYLRNIRPGDMKRVIKPNLGVLKEYSKDLDITLESGTIMQRGKNFISPRPTIDITISPKENMYSNVMTTKSSMIVDPKTGAEDFFDLLKSFVRNIFY